MYVYFNDLKTSNLAGIEASSEGLESPLSLKECTRKRK